MMNSLFSIFHFFVQVVSILELSVLGFFFPLQTELMLHCNNESSSIECRKQFTLFSSTEDLSRSLLMHLRQG